MAAPTEGPIVLLTFRVHEEGDYLVAECVELGTSSFGSTVDEAMDAVLSATELYLGAMAEEGQLETLLASKGVEILSEADMVRRPPDPVTVEVNEVVARRRVAV